jgi:hypothetical protein
MVVRLKGIENGRELLRIELDYFVLVSNGSEGRGVKLCGIAPPMRELTVNNGPDDLMNLALLLRLGARIAYVEGRSKFLCQTRTVCGGRRTSESSQ